VCLVADLHRLEMGLHSFQRHIPAANAILWAGTPFTRDSRSTSTCDGESRGPGAASTTDASSAYPAVVADHRGPSAASGQSASSGGNKGVGSEFPVCLRESATALAIQPSPV